MSAYSIVNLKEEIEDSMGERAPGIEPRFARKHLDSEHLGIATQLYKAKEPMTLFELQAWLGHRSPAATQHYAKIPPNARAAEMSFLRTQVLTNLAVGALLDFL